MKRSIVQLTLERKKGCRLLWEKSTCVLMRRYSMTHSNIDHAKHSKFKIPGCRSFNSAPGMLNEITMNAMTKVTRSREKPNGSENLCVIRYTCLNLILSNSSNKKWITSASKHPPNPKYNEMRESDKEYPKWPNVVELGKTPSSTQSDQQHSPGCL